MKASHTYTESCKYQLGFINCLAVDSDGRSGGISLMHKGDVNLAILRYSKFYIHALIVSEMMNKKELYITSVNGHSDTSHIIETWNLVRSLCCRDEKSWLVFENYNKILYVYEKWNRRN